MNAEQKRKWRNYLASLARRRRNKPRQTVLAEGGPYDGQELNLDWASTGTATFSTGAFRGHYDAPSNGLARWISEPIQEVTGEINRQ